jgi:predicted KAP-like P-loop ATPase
MSFLTNNKFVSRFFHRDTSIEPNSLGSVTNEDNVAADRVESDQPIQNSSDDKFGRWNFARRVADVIAKRRDPQTIVIGIHAPWGEGKPQY